MVLKLVIRLASWMPTREVVSEEAEGDKSFKQIQVFLLVNLENLPGESYGKGKKERTGGG